ncbi:MAG: hypothetical protein GY862_01230 [Gammaproteobacteria bacterium]|nr:hypothetical protein [Gammaproteobacteria bacterium]
MSGQRQKFAAPLPPEEMKHQVRNAVLLAGAAMVVALPMLLYQLQQLPVSVFTHPPDPAQLYQLAAKQAAVVFALALLCSLVGFLYAERLELPGFGTLRDIRLWLPLGFGAGLVFTPISYIAFDRELIQTLPELYPAFWLPALADMAGTTLTQEVVLRFGLLTICVYLLRWGNLFNGRLWPAILVIAAFGTLGTYLILAEFELAQRVSSAKMGAALVFSFAFQWLYCEIYLRWGFLAVFCTHLGFSVKFFVYALVNC